MMKNSNKTTKTRYNNVYRDYKGVIFFSVCLGKDENGKRITKKTRKSLKTGEPFKTTKQANEELQEFVAEWKKQHLTVIGNSDMAFADFVNNVFIPYYKQTVRFSTFFHKKCFFDRIIKYFGEKVKLTEIKSVDCLEFQRFLLNIYSQSTAHVIMQMLKRLLKYAENHELITKNPMDNVQMISKGTNHQPYWTADDFAKAISVLNKEKYREHLYIVVLTLYFATGVRLGEGLALQWEDIDFERKQLKVMHNLTIDENGKPILSDHLKTLSSRRIIDLDNATIDCLKEWRATQRNIYGDGFVLSVNGYPLNRTTISSMLERVSEKAGVKRISVKGLRHGHATLLAYSGDNIVQVARRLGHSNTSTTLKYYTHSMPVHDEIATNVMGKLLDSINENSQKSAK